MLVIKSKKIINQTFSELNVIIIVLQFVQVGYNQNSRYRDILYAQRMNKDINFDFENVAMQSMTLLKLFNSSMSVALLVNVSYSRGSFVTRV